MSRKILLAAGLAALLVAGGARAADPGSDGSRTHEFACTAATVGGAVAGVALGSMLGGGLGTTLFETAGGVMGGMAGHALKCPGK
jgi:hypothetical protein